MPQPIEPDKQQHQHTGRQRGSTAHGTCRRPWKH
jgi:hypothetical protein